MRIRDAAPILMFMLAGCYGGDAPRDKTCDEIEEIPGEPVILAIGDSVFAWKNQKCETIPDRVALHLDRETKLNAVNGARMSGGDYPIHGQLEEGPWEWVIMDGGGNDLNIECECGSDCGPVLDALISEDGATGEIPRLVERALRGGSRVLLYGYYEVGEKANYGFDECIGEIDELRARQSRVPDHFGGVTFVDGRDAVTLDNPKAYDFDDVHPSKEGARLVAELIAEAMLEAEEQ